jgi:hypothetical protein
MEIFKANRQWSTRPDDEKFRSLEEMHAATLAYRNTAMTSTVPYSQLRVEAVGEDVRLIGSTGAQAAFTNYAFGQLAARVNAPASYLRTLPPTLAAQNINYGIKNRVDISNGEADNARLLVHQNGSMLLRAITSEKYERIWNHEVIERMLPLQADGWEPARPDIRVIDDMPALYASDHDMFAFIRNRSVLVREPGNPDGLQRGVIVENSEVGASALKLTRFLYREMCGNHIIWGATKVLEIKIRHIGDARQRWQGYAAKIRQYANESASLDEARIASAQTVKIGETKEDVLDVLFSKRTLGLSRKLIEASYDATQPDSDGDPRTVWGFVQGMTRHSQTIPYADQRTTIDRAAGKVMEFAF